MPDVDKITGRYLGGDYLSHNPSWDSKDSPWKAGLVLCLMQSHRIEPRSIVDVGCGAGGVLGALRSALPATAMTGFDIAPDAMRFWEQHLKAGIELKLGDFFTLADRQYDVLLALDVLEHLPNPFDFLARLRGHARYYVFHFPLDLSALSVLRESPLLFVRRKVGHVHYFTKGLALMLLEECGYRVIESRYTGAAYSAPQPSWKTRLASIPRRVAYAVNKDWGARLLGGETLLVLARAA